MGVLGMAEIVSAMGDEVVQLQREIKEYHETIATKTTRLKQIERAVKYMRTLVDEETQRPASREPKSCATKGQVLGIVVSLLTDNETIAVDDLKPLVYGKLTESGVDLKGAAMRLREAITDPRFELSPSGFYRLAKTSS